MSFATHLAAIALAASAATTTAIAQPIATANDHATLTVPQMREDIAAFRSDFFARDKSYSAAAREQVEARLRNLEGKLDGMTPVAFELALDHLVALADNGHTIAAPGVRASHFNRVPIHVAIFGSELRVLRATDATSDLLGARLVSVDRHPVSELLDSARALVGGTTAWRDGFANFLVESPEQLHALGLAASAGNATYSFVTADGRSVDRQLAGEMDAAFPQRSQRWMQPALMASEVGHWRALLPVDKAPWSLGQPDLPFRWRAAPELKAIVIELRQMQDAPGHPIGEFLVQVGQQLQAARPQNLVVDVRMNGGGNLQLTRDFMKSLPILVPGRIFVLTSPRTFSAAISSVGYLKQAAPNRVTIVGEEVGDRLEFFAEGMPITLPHSGMMIGVATQRHEYKNGCRAVSDCHGAVVEYPIAVPTLAPEIPAPWTFDAYRAGRDPAMEAVRTALGGH